MRNITELTQLEAEFVTMLIEAYPAGQGYIPERDHDVRDLTVDLVAEGRVERTEIDEQDASGASYRLADGRSCRRRRHELRHSDERTDSDPRRRRIPIDRTAERQGRALARP